MKKHFFLERGNTISNYQKKKLSPNTPVSQKKNKAGHRRISPIYPRTSIIDFQFRLFLKNNFISKTVDHY